MAEITNELLKSAIADAEAVRETAIANAKVVLEEAITPQIRDMIARRLRAEADAPTGEEQVAEEAEEVEEGHNPHVGTDAGVIEHVRWQAHDGLQQVVLQHVTADLRLPTAGTAGEER